MAEQLEIILGLEKEGLLRRKIFTVETQGLPKTRYPSFCKAAHDVSKILLYHSDPLSQYSLTQTPEMRAFIDHQRDVSEDEGIILDMLEGIFILYNQLRALELGE